MAHQEPRSLVHVNSQSHSPLFRLPIDIRYIVYSYLTDVTNLHIIPRDRHLGLSTCFSPEIFPEEEIGDARRSTPTFDLRDPDWIRRLDSTWGPHWRCEEAALGISAPLWSKALSETPRHHFDALFTVCKMMYLDLAQYLPTKTNFHVKLASLEALLEPDSASSTFNLCASILPQLTRLSIIVNLPLAFFTAIESGQDTSRLHICKSERDIWFSLHRYLAGLPRLRHLTVWLDHTDKVFWSHVNERIVLSTLSTLQGVYEVRVVLPKAHPQKEDLERHYLASSKTPFPIDRALRLRFRVCKDEPGATKVVFAQDFPYCIGHPDFEDMPLAEKEKFERELWEAGENVEAWLKPF